jgi:APA family basic amino acid/polyamine antiporter
MSDREQVTAVSVPVSLERRLGTSDAAALVIANVVGVGIFTTPGVVAEMVPHPTLILALWLIGGAMALVGCFVYAELATLRPYAGGEYVYLREAFGPLAAFLTGWTSFVAGFSGAIAAGAVGLAAYLGHFIPLAADVNPFVQITLGILRLELSPRSLVALAAIWGFSLVHVLGLGPGRIVQNALVVLKILALFALVAIGFTFGSGSFDHLEVGRVPFRLGSVLVALIPILFTYSGWNAAAYMAEEVRDPHHTLPRGLALGTIVVVILYLLLNLLYLYALPVEKLGGAINTGVLAAQVLFGPEAAGAVAALLALGLASSVSAMILAGPRVYYAMARDGVFLRAAARIHARYRTPATAIIAQGVWSSALILSSTFEQLLTYTGFAVVLFAGVATLALFILRRVRPTEHRPFRAWGYPLAPALFCLVSLAIVVNSILESPGPSLAGLLIITAGVPIYWWSRRNRASSPTC